MPIVPVQTQWWSLRIRDTNAQRGLSFPNELVVPALNAGGLGIQPGECRIHPTKVEVIFQTSTRRRKAIDALKNWAPIGTDGPHRQIWVDWGFTWSNPPPFRVIIESHYAIHEIRRELERLIRDNDTAGQGDEEEFEGVTSEEEEFGGVASEEEADADQSDIAAADADEDAMVASCPICGANKAQRTKQLWKGKKGWHTVNQHIYRAHPERHIKKYGGTEQGVMDMLAASA